MHYIETETMPLKQKTISLFTFLFFLLIQPSVAMYKVSDQKPPKVLKHVVLFSFKEGSSETEIQKVINTFADLKNKIKTIRSFEWGINNSPERLNQGFTHCFTLTFKSEKDRDDYLPHPDHKAFGKVLAPVLDKVLVVDYWAR